MHSVTKGTTAPPRTLECFGISKLYAIRSSPPQRISHNFINTSPRTGALRIKLASGKLSPQFLLPPALI